MATYIENDIRNILIDIYNGDTIATTATYYGVLRITLRDYFKGTRSYRNIYNNK